MKKAIVWMLLMLLLTGCAGNVKSGVNLLKEKNYEEAVTVFQKDVKKGRNLDDAYRGLGIAYFELQEYDSAAESFELALDNDSRETAVIYGFLGACYMELEEFNRALDVYEKALDQEDITAELEQEIQYNIIALYEQKGDWKAAKKQMEKYIKNYPDDSRVDKEAEFLETR